MAEMFCANTYKILVGRFLGFLICSSSSCLSVPLLPFLRWVQFSPISRSAAVVLWVGPLGPKKTVLTFVCRHEILFIFSRKRKFGISLESMISLILGKKLHGRCSYHVYTHSTYYVRRQIKMEEAERGEGENQLLDQGLSCSRFAKVASSFGPGNALLQRNGRITRMYQCRTKCAQLSPLTPFVIGLSFFLVASTQINRSVIPSSPPLCP